MVGSRQTQLREVGRLEYSTSKCGWSGPRVSGISARLISRYVAVEALESWREERGEAGP